MKKIFKKMFSKSAFVALMIIFEILFISLMLLVIDSVLELNGLTNHKIVYFIAFMIFRFVGILIAIFVFLRVLNKNEDPEFKIPWIVLLLILPLFGTIIYLFFGNHGLRKRDRVIVRATNNACHNHFEIQNKQYKVIQKELGDSLGVFNYLHNTSLLRPHSHNRVTYFRSGEEFFPDLIECLKQAKQFIFIEFFIISEGKQYNAVLDVLKQKAKEGIDVRIIYDDFGCSGYLPANTSRKLAKFGIKCVRFAPLKPIISSIYNNRDHRKIVIIDHQYGYTGGINLADEYANITHPFKYWKDTMIKIEGSAINNLLAIFLKNYDLCVWEVSNYNQYLDYEYPKFKESGYVMPFGDGPGGFDNALIGEQNYINIINYARKTLYISTPYLIPTYPLLSALRNASLRGVDVRIIVPGVPDKKLVYWLGQRHFHFLLSAGIKIYTYTPGFNHMKTCIADGELAFVGTINMDFRSLVHHFECGATLYKNPCLKDIEEDFNEMFKASDLVPKNFKLNVFKRAICSVLKIFTPLF